MIRHRQGWAQGGPSAGPSSGHLGAGKVMPAQMAGSSRMSQERNPTLPMGEQEPERWHQPELGVATSGTRGRGPRPGRQASKRPPASITNCLMFPNVQLLREKKPIKNPQAVWKKKKNPQAVHSGNGVAGPLPTHPSKRQGREGRRCCENMVLGCAHQEHTRVSA